MYEQFKNDFLMQMSGTGKFTDEELKDILHCLDVAAYNYDVKKKETQIVPYNQELPPEFATLLIIQFQIFPYFARFPCFFYDLML